MSDFELLSVVLMVLGIIVTILISYIESTKKITATQSPRRLFV